MKKFITAIFGISIMLMACQSPLTNVSSNDHISSQEGAALDVAARAIQVTPAGAKPPAAPSTLASDPGSTVYPYASFELIKWTTAVEKRPVEAFIPKGATGTLPVLVWMGGKTLQGSSYYRNSLEHACRKGIIVVLVQADDGKMGFGNADHVKPARAINEAANEALLKFTAADPSQVYFGGHSLGAKCSVIAAALATGKDTTNSLVDPRGLLLFAFDNSNGGPGSSAPDNNNPANGYAVQISGLKEFTLVEFEDDTIAGPSKGYATALYAKLPALRSQHLRVRGAIFKTSPVLSANHNTVLTSGSPFAGGKGVLNALDWYSSWRLMVGLPLVAIQTEYQPYVWGNLRTDGGICSNGAALTHLVMAQNF